ncbi:hypothetical protein DPEC_G00217130 [Dallia pectoralis]|uniref:Uncharacterized protein n=1 Tax=Dallia pectoralis TaxID=75939 RepID=A0ACC2G2T2_DALPE|nr:hypothetical protein DPEC_G00217130 [Dallia pectoralis]
METLAGVDGPHALSAAATPLITLATKSDSWAMWMTTVCEEGDEARSQTDTSDQRRPILPVPCPTHVWLAPATRFRWVQVG